MSIILEGIDMPKRGETKRIVLYDNGDIVVNEEGWDEDGDKFFRTSYDVKAIQIPTPHGRLIDGDKLCYEFIDWQYTEAPDHLNTKEGRMVTDHERQYEVYLALGEAVIEIANAPTILEEEE